MLKGMEKIVDNEIRSNILRFLPLHASQLAYRARRPTNTALFQLFLEIQSSLNNGDVAICAFLDIVGAFD